VKTERRLVLASASPRRRALLESAGYVFDILSVDVDEGIPPGMDPAEGAVQVARRKAEAAALRTGDALVIAADTIVVTPRGEILGKPRDPAHARAMLADLSGTTHTVITGVFVRDTRNGASRGRAVMTEVVFGRMSPEEIEEYVTSGEAMGKAGAYAIQETGDRFVTELRGSFTNVVGLPMETVEELLLELAPATEPEGGQQ
jgi:septum formation protein